MGAPVLCWIAPAQVSRRAMVGCKSACALTERRSLSVAVCKVIFALTAAFFVCRWAMTGYFGDVVSQKDILFFQLVW